MHKCPLCSSSDTATEQGARLCHCGRCDLIFKFPADWPQAYAEKARYDTHQNSLEDESYTAMLESFISEAVTPFVSPDAKGLDYGSGPTPVLSELLRQKGFVVDIYDPFFAPKDLQLNGQYDFLTCTEVLEHVHSPLAMWQTFKGLLRPNGVISVTTHFHLGLERASKWWYIRDNTHVVFYSLKTFAYVGEAFSLDLVYHDDKKTVVLRNI